MARLVAAFFSATDVPLESPGDDPTIRVRRLDTGALEVTDLAMTEIGDGEFAFDFTTVATLEYSWRANGDPTASGQTVIGGRFVFGVASGIVDARIEADIVAILADTDSLDTTKITTSRADNLDEITAIRLAELDAANIPADLDTLLARLTAARAANLDEITSVRLAELDAANLPADVDTLLTGVALVLSTGGAGPWTSATAAEADRVEVSVISTSSTPGIVRIAATLYRNGVRVTSGITGGTVLVRVPGDPGSTLIPSTALEVGDDSVLFLDVAAITLADATNYYAIAAITDGVGTVTGLDHNPTI